MHDRPNATEILEAVARLLADELVPATTGRLQFVTRVAANAVRLVAREIAQGDGPARAEWQGLDTLLGSLELPADTAELGPALVERNHELARALREGAFDEPAAFARVTHHLRHAVAAKLAVSDPAMIEDTSD